MGKILGIVAAALAAATAAGCQQQPKPAASQSALDVRPVHKLTPTYALSSEAVTPPDEPRAALGTGPMLTTTPDFERGPAAARPGKTAKTGAPGGGQGNSYKVKKGDTLYHIAKAEYGDGKKWTLIASANPGVSPESLRAGQTLRIP